MKTKVTINIDNEIYQESHELGINVSKACENYLKQLNAAIKATNNKNNPNPNPEKAVAGPMGFEPMTFSLEGSQRGTAEYWHLFREYVNQRIKSRTWQSTIFNYAQEYSNCLFSRDLSLVQSLADSKRPNVLKALSALAKFDGCSNEFRPLMQRYGLKWTGRSKDDIFIDRLISTTDSEEIWRWIREVKGELPVLVPFLDLMSTSGLRFIESVNSFNLIGELARTNKLTLFREGKNYQNGYFNREVSSLEHFWFRDIFLRNTKKAFVSFVSPQLIDEIGVASALDAGVIQQTIRRRGLDARFSDIREAHATFMVKYLKAPEIDFLHGRVQSNVFMANYFNPSLISDLKARVFQGISEIQEKIRL